ncbi:MAG: dTDP-4-dehydrorhamnose 3,5-epimerase family protein [Acidobacteriota bacterium]
MPDRLELRQDAPSVTPEGKRLEKLIDGVVMRRLTPQEDKRGELVELYRLTWDIHPDPLVYSYMVAFHPGAIRGWSMHKLQEDRIAVISGFLRWALYDNRPESPTYKKLNVFTLSERNRTLFTIPRNVIHAAQNVGTTEAVFINYPTRPYDHANPDKHRISHDDPSIPFRFDDPPGW